MYFFLAFRKAEGEDADSDVFLLLQLAAAGGHSGTSGDDIVDDEEVVVPLLVQFVAVHFEGSFHVFLATESLGAGLALGETGALHEAIDDGDACHLADAEGNVATLVVAALALAPTGDGDGHEGVDAFKEAVARHLLGSNTPELFAEEGLVVVFHLVDDVTEVGACLVVAEGCRALRVDGAPEETRHRVVGCRRGKVGARHGEQATDTDALLGDCQPTAASSTQAGCKDVEKTGDKRDSWGEHGFFVWA